ncbi:hypothetical protein D3C71_582750 [compost metagenome]
MVLLGLDILQRFCSFASHRGFLGQQQRLTLFHFPRFFLFACAVEGQARTARNQAADDDVLFQAAQTIALAHDRRFGQHAGGFLERSGRDERVGRQRCLGNTQQDVFVGRWNLVLNGHAIVLVQQFRTLYLLANDVVGVAGIDDLNTAQHLTHDHFDVLVIDLHALQTVHVLHFVNDVTCQRFDTQQAQDVLRIGRAVHDHLTLVHDLAVMHQHLLVLGDQELMLVAVHVRDFQTLLALGFFTERNRTRDFRQHTGIFRRARFEQFGNAWQTTGNIARFLRFGRNTCQHFTNRYLLTVLDHDQRADLEADRHRVFGAGDLDFFVRVVDQLDLRTQRFRQRTATFRIDRHQGGQTGHFVDLTGYGDAFFDVLETHLTGVFGNDRTGQRIPRCQGRTGLDDHAVLDDQGRTVRYFMTLTLTAMVVGNQHFAGTGNDDLRALAVRDVTHGCREANGTVRLGFHRRCHCCTRCRTTNVERTHGQLGTRLTNRLRCHHTDGFAGVDQHAAAQIAAIALGAQAEARVASQWRADLDFIDGQTLDLFDHVFVHQGAGFVQRFLGFRIDDVMHHDAAEDTVTQRFDDFTTFDQRLHDGAVHGAAIIFDHHQVLRHVNQTTRQVTGVSRFQRRIGQTFTSTVGRNEVLQNVQTFAEVRGNRRFDNRTIRFGHQTTHTGQLANLGCGTARAGVGHHVNGVERFLRRLGAVAADHVFDFELVHHGLADFIRGFAPDIDYLVVTLAGGHETRGVLLFDLLDFRFGRRDQGDFLRRYQHVVDADRDTGACRQAETRLHQFVCEHHGGAQAALAERRVDQLGNFFLFQRAVQDGERQAFWQNFRQDRTADRRFVTRYRFLEFARFGVFRVFGNTHGDAGRQFDFLVVVGADHFRHVREHHPFVLRIDRFAGRVVQTQHDILGRNDRWFAVRWEQDVVRCQHQGACFHLRFDRQRNVDRHLVTVKVGVECGADERVQLDGLAFNQDWLERLDTQTVQRRCAVQHDRMFTDHVFQDVPHDRLLNLDQLFGGLDRGSQTHQFQFIENEWLEQFQRHQFRQAALMQFQLRAHDDDRTTGVIDAFAQQVLTETAALALDHLCQRFQRTLVGAGHRFAATAVVQQRIDRFLQHALFVARDDLWSTQLHQAFQTVVTVDDAAIQIVQIRGRETAAIQRYQRTQFRRQHWQHFHDHPVRLDARTLERFQHFQALRVFLDLGFGFRFLQFHAQGFGIAVDVDRAQQFTDTFGAHEGGEVVAVLFVLGGVVVFRHDLALFQRSHAWIGHDVCFKVQHAFDVPQGHVQDHAQTRRQRLQEPDVRGRRGQLDVAHALAAHFGQGDFDAALFADHAAVFQALVLAAQAFVILDRAKDLGAEQAVALRLEGTVVDGFRLLDFAVGPRTDFLRRSETDLDCIEGLVGLYLLE